MAGSPQFVQGVREAAGALGMDPTDLATIISYETAGTFDPAKKGQTTQWGQHKGLIQFGEPQARAHGVDWNNPEASQLGADGAIVRYFRSSGWKPGMGMLDAYSIVNAGGPGLYNRSDANNSGAPGTVADKVRTQMGGHRKNAIRLLGGSGQPPQATTGTQGAAPMMQQEQKPRGLLEGFGVQKMEEGAEGETGQRFYQRDSFKDTAALLAQGFGRMGIMGMEEIADNIANQRTENKAKNKTVEFLRKSGRTDLADAVANNVLGARDAASMMFAKPEGKVRQVTGASLGMTGPNADRLYNVAPDGKITAIGGSAPVTNINTPGAESEWEKGIGKFGVETFSKIQNEASSAQDLLANTVVLENLMADPSFSSGALAEQKMSYAKIIEALGGDAADVGSLEAFRAVTSKLILDSMGGSLGAGFSEGDRKFVEGMGAQLSTSKEGNKMIIDLNRKIASRKLEIASFADNYVKENGMIDQRFMGALREWSQQNPLFKAVDASSYLPKN